MTNETQNTKRRGRRLVLYLPLVLVVAVYYFVFCYRFAKNNVVWTDVKRLLVNKKVDNLHDLYNGLVKLNFLSDLNYREWSDDRDPIGERTECDVNGNEVKVVAVEEVMAEIGRANYIKPGRSAMSIKYKFLLETSYPTLWENMMHFTNPTTVIAIYLDKEDRIIGWSLSNDHIDMRP